MFVYHFKLRTKYPKIHFTTGDQMSVYQLLLNIIEYYRSDTVWRLWISMSAVRVSFVTTVVKLKIFITYHIITIHYNILRRTHPPRSKKIAYVWQPPYTNMYILRYIYIYIISWCLYNSYVCTYYSVQFLQNVIEFQTIIDIIIITLQRKA